MAAGSVPQLAFPVAVAAAVIGRAARRDAAVVAAVLAAAGVASGWAAGARSEAVREIALPAGRVVVAARVETDPVSGRFGTSFAVAPTHLLVDGGRWIAWSGPRLVVDVDVPVAVGERVVIGGRMVERPGMYRGDPVAGRIVADAVGDAGVAADPLSLAGNAVRSRITAGLARFRDRPEAALLAGFMIGDVRALPPGDVAALQSAGLSHFVAVSGSNVALFLAGWWMLTIPITPGPRTRAAVGLAGLLLFAVVTRFEPSVVRASMMAAVVLIGRLAGFAVGGWAALGWAVGGVLLISGDLAGDVGFQLSVAATAGVLAGSRLWADRRPRWVWTALGATIAAQVAVAPLLLAAFGTVPLAAPLTNVVAAPLVAGATVIGSIGVLTGLDIITMAALSASGAVLAIARGTAGMAQLGPVEVAGLVLVAAVARWRPARPLVAGLAAAGLLASAFVGPGAPDGPEVVVLDVGQGDAVVLWGPSGGVILVDGGPDPAVLQGALRRRGISRVDLLVISHRHADHVGGLRGISSVARVVRVWRPPEVDDGAVAAVLTELSAAGATIETPAPGWAAAIGDFTIEVLGPLRRYASANDGSIVLRAAAAGRTVLLPGDVERFAQADLGPIAADVMKVPHQGAATSDLRWLAAGAPTVAVVSVGTNDFGHPADSVIEVLEDAGAVVLRTDRHGDVVIRLDRLPPRSHSAAVRRRSVAPGRYRRAGEADHRRGGPLRRWARGARGDPPPRRGAPR